VSICVAAGTYHLSNENDGSCAKGPLRARAAGRQFKKKIPVAIFSNTTSNRSNAQTVEFVMGERERERDCYGRERLPILKII